LFTFRSASLKNEPQGIFGAIPLLVKEGCPKGGVVGKCQLLTKPTYNQSKKYSLISIVNHKIPALTDFHVEMLLGVDGYNDLMPGGYFMVPDS